MSTTSTASVLLAGATALGFTPRFDDVASDSRVVALDPRTGETLWIHEPFSPSSLGGASLEPRERALVVRRWEDPVQPALSYCLDLRTGERLEMSPAAAGERPEWLIPSTERELAGGLRFLRTRLTDEGQRFEFARSGEGRVAWSIDAGYQCSGRVYGDTVVVAEKGGRLHAYRAGDARPRWELELARLFPREKEVSDSPALGPVGEALWVEWISVVFARAGEVLVVAWDALAVALDLDAEGDEARVLWTFELGDDGPYSIASDGERIYAVLAPGGKLERRR